MANGDGGIGVFVLLAEHGSHGFAHNISAAKDDDFSARDLDLGAD
jgi:hypothetical protein